MEKPLIMIVDDNPNNLKIISNILIENDYRVAIANNGHKAIANTEIKRPDLILLDIMMPDIDGFEVCQLLKENSLTADIPIIFITAKDDSTDIIRGFHLGASDYITKPFKSEEVLVRINNILGLVNSKKLIQKQNEQLQALVTQRNRIISIISHDLKNPIGAIMMLSDLILTETNNLTLEEMVSFAKNMYSSSEQALKLLENLLDWAKSQYEDFKPKFTDFEIEDILQSSIDLVSLSALNKEIHIEYLEHQNLMVYADYNMVATITRNLLSNALKFTPRGGKITISTVVENDFLRIFISDTGIGIPQEILKTVYEGKSVNTRVGTESEKGSGIGLFLVKAFVELNNGKINIKSTPDTGTEISFTLKLSKLTEE